MCEVSICILILVFLNTKKYTDVQQKLRPHFNTDSVVVDPTVVPYHTIKYGRSLAKQPLQYVHSNTNLKQISGRTESDINVIKTTCQGILLQIHWLRAE